MTTLYYITRSYPSYQISGGSLMREAQVVFFEKHFSKVVVVMPNYATNTLVCKNNVIQIPFKYNERFANLMERVGIYEDSLDAWVKSAYLYLKNIITSNDILFSTCGGELASMKLGSKLKEFCNCTHVVNFHDPLDYSRVNGKVVDRRLHVIRDPLEKKYLHYVDLVITSSTVH